LRLLKNCFCGTEIDVGDKRQVARSEKKRDKIFK